MSDRIPTVLTLVALVVPAVLVAMAATATQAGTSASASTWVVTEGSEVVFASSAPMESFEGRTGRITGDLACVPDDGSGEVTLRMEVDLASLDTGIGLRNRHMRENHLETGIYPTAVFTGGTVVTGDLRDLRPGATVRLEVRGVFNLHGISRETTVPAEVTMAADGSLTVTAAFTVKLSDHEIERPRFLVMKLADEQEVSVSLRLARKEAP